MPATVHSDNGVVWRSGLEVRHGRYDVNLFNESTDSIQCHATFGDDAPFDVVVHPLELRTAITIPGAPPSGGGVLTSVCTPIPTTAPPAPQAGSCAIELLFDGSPDDYYPPGGIRRREQGIVLVDFDFRYDMPRRLNPKVVVSSGFSDLDNAALKLLRNARIAVQGCVAGRARRGISFAIKGDPPAPGATRLPVAPNEVIHVTAFRIVLSSDPALERE